MDQDIAGTEMLFGESEQFFIEIEDQAARQAVLQRVVHHRVDRKFARIMIFILRIDLTVRIAEGIFLGPASGDL